MKEKAKNDHGFTLVEIIISIALIGIIAVSFITMFTSGFSAIFTMGRKTKSMNYDAQTYMERIYEGESADTINAIDGVSVLVENDYNGTGLKLVTITVDYSPDRSVTLKSLVPD